MYNIIVSPTYYYNNHVAMKILNRNLWTDCSQKPDQR